MPPSRRELITAAVVGGISSVAGCNFLSDGGQTDSQQGDGEDEATDDPASPTDTGQPSEIIVEEGESIQESIDRVAPEGRVVVPGATFEESLTIDKSVTLTTSNRATLDGTDASDEAAITVAASSVTVSGFEIFRYEGGIRTSSEVDSIEISDVTLSDIGEEPIQVQAASTALSGIVAENCGAPVTIEAARDGEVSLDDIEISQNTGGGLLVSGGSTLTASSVVALQNGGDGVVIEGGTARGQSVTVTGGRVVGHQEGRGIVATGTDGEDTVRIEETSVADNSGAAIDATAETVEVVDASASANGPTAASVAITSTREGTVTVRGTTVESTAREDGGLGSPSAAGEGISITGGQTVTVADTELVDNQGPPLTISPGDVREQTVEVSGCSVQGSQQGVGIFSQGASDVTITDTTVTGAGFGGVNIIEAGTATLRNVTANANEQLGGLNVNAETVTIEGAELSENTMDRAAALDVTVLSEGTATVRDVTVSDSEAVALGSEGGVFVRGGSTVTVENITSLRNPRSGVQVVPEDVLGQTVEIRGTTADSNEDDGIEVASGSSQDELTIENTTASNNGSYGFDLGGQNITIQNATASENEEGSLNLRDTSRGEITISGSSL